MVWLVINVISAIKYLDLKLRNFYLEHSLLLYVLQNIYHLPSIQLTYYII